MIVLGENLECTNTNHQLVDLFDDLLGWDLGGLGCGHESWSLSLVASRWKIEDLLICNTVLVVVPFLQNDSVSCTSLGEDVDWDSLVGAQDNSQLESKDVLSPYISLQLTTKGDLSIMGSVLCQAEWLQ